MQVAEQEKDRVLVVHVDEVEIEEVVVGVDEHQRFAQDGEGLDVLPAQFRAQDNERVGGVREGRVEDALDRRGLEVEDLEGETGVLRPVAQSLDVFGEEDVVVAVDRMSMAGDVKEAERPRGGKPRRRVTEFTSGLEDAVPQFLARARLVVEHERDGRRGDAQPLGDVAHPNAHFPPRCRASQQVTVGVRRSSR